MSAEIAHQQALWQVLEVGRVETELAESRDDPDRVLVTTRHPDVEIGCRSGFAVERHGEPTDQQVLNLGLGTEAAVDGRRGGLGDGAIESRVTRSAGCRPLMRFPRQSRADQRRSSAKNSSSRAVTSAGSLALRSGSSLGVGSARPRCNVAASSGEAKVRIQW